MKDKEKIKEEIEKEMRVLDLANDFDNGRFSELNYLKLFIDSFPEEHNEDLEEEIETYINDNFSEGCDGGMLSDYEPNLGGVTYCDLANLARHFAEWGRNYVIEAIEETLGYLQTHDISIPQIMLLRIREVLDKLKTNKRKFQ